MSKTTLKGTVQVRVMADPDDAEAVGDAIEAVLVKRDLIVIERTPEYNDRYDPERKKFHITAIPNYKETQNATN